ncbi:hypothetical protein DHODJN_18705 [Methylorubrum extorquens]
MASWAERLETEMQELLAACESESGAQTSNSQHSDRYLVAYAEGALRVPNSIAARIREKAAARPVPSLSSPLPTPVVREGA